MSPGFVSAQNRYGRYCVPAESTHRPAAKAVLAGEVWEPETTAFLAKRAAEGDVVTAGTYFGDMLPAAASGGHTVYAAEPNPENFTASSATIAANALTNVRLVNAALGARAGRARLLVTDIEGVALGGGSHVVSRLRWQRGGRRTVGCDIVSIDDLVGPESKVTLIQLDVEGHEAEALRGALQTIRRCLPDIVVETPPKDGPVLDALRKLGYGETSRLDRNTLLSVR